MTQVSKERPGDQPWPEEILPVMGTLEYRNYPRTKFLIARLADHLAEDVEKPAYPEWKVTPDKVCHIFSELDRYLGTGDFYPHIGAEVRDLITDAKKVTTDDQILALRTKAEAIEDLPDVDQDQDYYSQERLAGRLHCFFCEKEIDEGGSNSSTEFGVFYACDNDWPKFDNPDRFT